MPPQTPSDEMLTRVAELRAAGQTWQAVGAAVNRKPLTVRTWPRMYPYRWGPIFAAAQEQLLAEVTRESVLSLRHQLRSESDAARAKAADLLLRHTHKSDRRPRAKKRDTRPKLSPQILAIAAEIDGKTDAELDQLLAELAELEMASAADAAGDPANPPGDWSHATPAGPVTLP